MKLFMALVFCSCGFPVKEVPSCNQDEFARLICIGGRAHRCWVGEDAGFQWIEQPIYTKEECSK